jgi:hypothetical protein
MPKRVETGCSNCVRCTGSAAGNAARSLTEGSARAMAGLMTLGISSAMTKKCKGCGHRMADHRDPQQAAPVAVVVNPAPPQPYPVQAPHWQPAPPPPQPLTIAQRGEALRELNQQLAEGLITQQEFDAERHRIMNS